MSSVTEAPSLFLRNATGLVKGWSGFDAFGYSFMSVNLVTLGMFYSLAVFAFVPDGSVLSALLLSGIVMTFLCVTYAGLDRGHAAGRRRLRLADPDPRRHPGHSSSALSSAASRSTSSAQAFGPATRWRPASAASSVSSEGLPSAGSAAGSASSCPRPAGGSSSPCGRRSTGSSCNIEVVQPLAAIAGWQDGSDVLRRRAMGPSRSRCSRSSSPRARSPWAWPATPASRSGASGSA